MLELILPSAFHYFHVPLSEIEKELAQSGLEEHHRLHILAVNCPSKTHY